MNTPGQTSKRKERAAIAVLLAGALVWSAGMTLGLSPLGQYVPKWAWGTIEFATLAGLPICLIGLVMLLLIKRR